MKKTVIFKTIDDHDIVVGFGVPTIDPIETNKVVNEAIKDTPEHKAAEAKKQEYAKAVADVSAAVKANDKTAYNTALRITENLQEEQKSLAKALRDTLTNLRREKAVYFAPRAGEAIIPATEVEHLLKAHNSKPRGVFIAIGGKHVADNRGTVYYLAVNGTWVRTTIVRLGDTVPAKAVLESELTSKQWAEVERDRVSALSASEKETEKAIALDKALSASVTMKNELEVKSDNDALKKSQGFYKKESERISKLYG